MLSLLVAALTIFGSAVLSQNKRPIDARTFYDVLAYELELTLDPQSRQLIGRVTVEAAVSVERLNALELDLGSRAEVLAVERLGFGATSAKSALDFVHENERLVCRLGNSPAQRDEKLRVAVDYRLLVREEKRGLGLLWERSPGGEAWIASFSQPVGAHTWWPCKSSFFHPEDKADRVRFALTVPEGLVAVANGRQVGAGGRLSLPPTALREQTDQQEWRTFHWVHEYPISTFMVAIAVGPFREFSRALTLPEMPERLPFQTWVLPEAEEMARVQFAQVQELLDVYIQHFGPYPFPRSKLGIVQVPFLGMGHPSLISYGSSFPAWCKERGIADPRHPHNRDYDRTLVHELAHEWWGNSVSASDWGEMWLHEGFATYAEGVWLEAKLGRDAADMHFERLARAMRKDARLILGTGLTTSEGFASSVYEKGAVVLHTLRHYLNNDELWWKSLQDYQAEYRYRSASTLDFQTQLESTTSQSWSRFFDEWVRGVGTPSLSGSLCATTEGVELDIHNGSDSGQAFHVPLDLCYWVGGESVRQRVELRPGANHFTLRAAGPVEGLRVLNLGRLPGRHKLRVD